MINFDTFRRIIATHFKYTNKKKVLEDKQFILIGLVGKLGEVAKLIKRVMRGDHIPNIWIKEEIADIHIYLTILSYLYYWDDNGKSTMNSSNIQDELDRIINMKLDLFVNTQIQRRNLHGEEIEETREK